MVEELKIGRILKRKPRSELSESIPAINFLDEERKRTRRRRWIVQRVMKSV
jgi:hypothetical protein